MGRYYAIWLQNEDKLNCDKCSFYRKDDFGEYRRFECIAQSVVWRTDSYDEKDMIEALYRDCPIEVIDSDWLINHTKG